MPSYDRIISRVIPHIEYHQNRYARGLEEAITPGVRWLDVGAGTQIHGGWVGLKEQELVARAQFIVGCDMVVEHLRRNASLSAAVGADANHLPFADASFDVVTANMVVEHLEDPMAMFSEVARVLRPGGRFLFVTPNKQNPVVFLASILLSRPARKAMARVFENRAEEHIFYTFYRANTRGDMRTLAARLPFKPKVIETFNSYPFARKPWPLTMLEALWIRLIQRPGLRVLCTNLFVDLERA
jgi:ubiquinone/menaquinone biosynthesis C-methylase UbiE